MNKKIRELAEQANGPNPFFGALKNQTVLLGDNAVEKFAELILQEHVELLKQRWYTLNNAVSENNETPRDIGMRVGQKAEVTHCIHLLSNHSKDRSDDPTEERQQDS